ncbi:hypothetical protein CVIRNUC_001394 [Coccomyxa viridis]|uniref:Elongator complex protein 4 n=1 Tax=Coccomyxa viridis TaxID=1274662 RepID=A0AAV1HV95_9CHLO|nr:hypothetical protein CVIRNUC_001394 [Coccomyxa viridis]
MKSSFVRKREGNAAADLGTRSGVHNETLISTGLADLDNLLGGGIRLGTVVLLLQDALTPHGSTFLRYFVAEGAACGHTVHWAGASRPLASALPQLAKPRSHTARKESSKETADEEIPQLRIAWQYRRYIQRQQLQQQSGLPALQEDTAMSGIPALPSSMGRLTSSPAKGDTAAGTSKDWCHQFDLTKSMEDCGTRTAHLECRQYTGPQALDRLVADVQHMVDTLGRTRHDSASPSASRPPAPLQGPASIGRLAIEGLGTAAWRLGVPAPEQSRLLLLASTKIRALLKAALCSAMITVPAGELEASAVARLELLGDAVIVLEAVREDSGIARMISDGNSCCGLLRVQKSWQSSKGAKALPQADVHVIRHKRRRLAIEVLQVDPDAEAAEAERANKKSITASLLCSGPPQANTPLDF